MRSMGRSRKAWLRASMRTSAYLWYSSTHVREHLPAVGQVRVVDLEHEAGVDDLPVLLAHGVRYRVEELLVRLVVLVVEPVLHGAGGDGGQVGLDVEALDGSAQVGDVLVGRLFADVLHG